MLLDVLKGRPTEDGLLGTATKKQRLEEGTPLKHYLRPIIEEAMIRRLAMMQNMQPVQSPQVVGNIAEPSPINPLQNALEGGSPYAS